MRTATRQASTVTSHAIRPRFTVPSSTSTGTLWPQGRTDASPLSAPQRAPIFANSENTAAVRGFPPQTWREWARARFREGDGCPQTVLASLFPTKVEGGASDQI